MNFFHEHNCRSQELIDQRLEQIRKAVPATRDQAVLESSIVLTHWVCKIHRRAQPRFHRPGRAHSALGESASRLPHIRLPARCRRSDGAPPDRRLRHPPRPLLQCQPGSELQRDRSCDGDQAATASGCTCAGLARSSSGRRSTNGPATLSHSASGPVPITASNSTRRTATMPLPLLGRQVDPDRIPMLGQPYALQRAGLLRRPAAARLALGIGDGQGHRLMTSRRAFFS